MSPRPPPTPTPDPESAAIRASYLDALPDPVVAVSAASGRILDVNGALAQVTGVPRAEWRARPAAELAAPEGRAALESILQRASAAEAAADEFPLARAGGPPLPVEAAARRLTAPRGPNTVLLVLRDVTGRKRVEEEVRTLYRDFAVLYLIGERVTATLDPQAIADETGEALLRLLDRECGAAIHLLDEERGTLRAASRRRIPAPLAEALGEPEVGKDLLGRVAVERRPILVQDPALESPAVARAAAAAGCRALLGVPLRSRDRAHGVLVLAAYDEKPFTQADFELLSSVGNEVGIALENARLHRQVQRSEERYRELVQSSPVGILEISEDGRILTANEAAAKILRRTREQLLALPAERLYRDVGERLRLLADFRSDGVLTERDVEYAAGDGSTIVLSLTSRRVPGAEGGPPRCQDVIRDVTEQRALQQKLLQTEKLASIGQMISGIAHELNNPLTGVLGYAQLLMEGECPPAIRRDLERINQDALRCKKIIENLMRFARKERPRRSVVSLNEEVEAVIELRRYHLTVGNIQVAKELDPDLPYTLADAHQLQQVFLNIVNNAVDAMQEARGSGTLTVRTAVRDARIHVEFEDDGPGIAPDHVARIFDPFFTTKEVGKGTGLGLSVSYEIVHEHGGEILVRSEPGKGATFTVALPVERITPEGARRKPTTRRYRVVTGTRRILLVDDEPTVLDVTHRVLEDDGYVVTRAGSGLEALEALGREGFDVLLTDLAMPGMDGRELYAKVRENWPDLARRVVVFTGNALDERTREFLEATRVAHIAKPYLVRELRALLQRVLTEEVTA